MAIQRGPVRKRCAYLGIEATLLGYGGKPSKRTAPARSKPSAYALQLKEKQKVKFVYGVMERQFRRNFEKALRQGGSTGENLLTLMEKRLDNAVFRSGLAKTRAEARQLVSHRHVTVNGRRVSIPSQAVKQGDEIALRDDMAKTLGNRDRSGSRALPGWLSRDGEANCVKVLREPRRSDVDFDVREAMIVELYSK